MPLNTKSKIGGRPVRVANCSGYHGDPSYEMYRQATLGDVDFITGDYLAEVNMANNAQAYRAGQHPGYEETAWEGLQQTVDVIARKGIFVVINGGALNPRGLAEKVEALVRKKQLNIRVAYLSGDDLYSKFGPDMPNSKDLPEHLDSDKTYVRASSLTYAFLKAKEPVPMISAHAYLGARGIVEGLRRGADIIICGRVADASPVVAAAWFWHSWTEVDYDCLAGALVAGHLIECSAYVTGGNFAGFDQYPVDRFIEPGFPIAEIDRDGSCVITKHPNTGGMVNVDTVRCQFVYELQGNVYLNSDVAAHLDNVVIENAGTDRVRVHGILGSPPPPTTKLAIFYQGGFESQLLLNATGYATPEKWDLVERQIRHFLPENALENLETLEFQRIGVPATNPACQTRSTTYLRVFATSASAQTIVEVAKAMRNISLKHFSGFHSSLDQRTAAPRPFHAYFPAVIKQADLDEVINFVDGRGLVTSYLAGHPPKYEPLKPRDNYDPSNPMQFNGALQQLRLGDIAFARSGDKGANLNIGLFVLQEKHWGWLQSFMTCDRMRQLIGKDWHDSFILERVEFPHIHAVHFVIYGILGRGVSSSSRLDGFGKGFADYIRDKVIEFPVEIL